MFKFCMKMEKKGFGGRVPHPPSNFPRYKPPPLSPRRNVSAVKETGIYSEIISPFKFQVRTHPTVFNMWWTKLVKCLNAIAVLRSDSLFVIQRPDCQTGQSTLKSDDFNSAKGEQHRYFQAYILLNSYFQHVKWFIFENNPLSLPENNIFLHCFS